MNTVGVGVKKLCASIGRKPEKVNERNGDAAPAYHMSDTFLFFRNISVCREQFPTCPVNRDFTNLV